MTASKYIIALLAVLVLVATAFTKEENREEQEALELFQSLDIAESFNSIDLGNGELLNGPDKGEVEAETGPFRPKPKPHVKACWKDGESRGKGARPDRSTRECPATQEKSWGMCYPLCGDKRNGFGPVCLDDCSKMQYTANGMVFCCDTDAVCKDLVQTLAMKFPKSIVRLALDLAANPNDIRRIMRDFREMTQTALALKLPLCSKLAEEGGEFKEEQVEVEKIIPVNDIPYAAEF